MTRLYLDVDGTGEETIWHDVDHVPVAVLRRCDIPASQRHLWQEIARRLTELDADREVCESPWAHCSLMCSTSCSHHSPCDKRHLT